MGNHGVARRWRNMPAGFPAWQSVYRRATPYYFRTWRADHTLDNLNRALNKMERERQGKEETPSLFCIAGRPLDTQPVKTAPFVSHCKGVDGNKKINGRKRHVITDTLGLVWTGIVQLAELLLKRFFQLGERAAWFVNILQQTQ